MFGISFSELSLILIVALIVIGPEKMPDLVRSVGKMVGKFRYFSDNLRDDLEKEFKLNELKQSIHNDNQLAKIRKDLTSVAKEAEKAVRSLEHDVQGSISKGEKILQSETSAHQKIQYKNADGENLADELSGSDLGLEEAFDDEFFDEAYFDFDDSTIMTAPPATYQPIYHVKTDNDVVESPWLEKIRARQLALALDEKSPSALVYQLQRQQKNRVILSATERNTLYANRMLELNAKNE